LTEVYKTAPPLTPQFSSAAMLAAYHRLTISMKRGG
jgi:hypothetical protein